ncbi:unnamed protein product, partial [Mesorhabditis belari]|uniref:Uncharacterized protein n=1 Tax=Mesorhabditis belari TaxID=2138241 RepID=A0AAF3FL09_9BILA
MSSRGKVVHNELDLLAAKNSGKLSFRIEDPKRRLRDGKDEKSVGSREKDREPRKDDRDANRNREKPRESREKEDTSKRDKLKEKDKEREKEREKERPRSKEERRDSKTSRDLRDSKDRDQRDRERRRSPEKPRDRNEPVRRGRDEKDTRKDDRKRNEPEKASEKTAKRKKTIDESSSEEEEFEVAPSIFGKPLPQKGKGDAKMDEEDKDSKEKVEENNDPTTSKEQTKLLNHASKLGFGVESTNSPHSAPSPSPPSPESDLDYEMPTVSKVEEEKKEDPIQETQRQSLSDKTAVFRQAIEHMIGWTAPPDDPPQTSPEPRPQKRKRSMKDFADRYRQDIHEEAKATVVQWYYNREIDKGEYKEVMKEIVKPCLKYQIRSKSEIRKRAIKVLQDRKKKFSS